MNVQKEKKKRIDLTTVDSIVAIILFISFMITMIMWFITIRFN